MSELLNQYSREFQSGRDLRPDDTEAFFDALVEEQDEELLGGLLKAWGDKGTSEDELYALASIMRLRCSKVSSSHETFVDVVGTGGSRSKTFNVSTAAAFVIAGAGVAVAKHGNRAATSNTGSADVLSALGVEAKVEPATAEHCLNEIGICFMFAPNFHRLSPVLAKVRRGLGRPTAFNNLGPLCNPANAPHQVIGVWDESVIEKTAKALARLGTKRSWVVHGSDGLDELTISGSTFVSEITNGEVKSFEVGPEDFGIGTSSAGDLRCDTPEESASLIRSILDGSSIAGAAVDLVKMNAAVAIYITGKAKDLREAFDLSTRSLESGDALAKLERLALETNKK